MISSPINNNFKNFTNPGFKTNNGLNLNRNSGISNTNLATKKSEEKKHNNNQKALKIAGISGLIGISLLLTAIVKKRKAKIPPTNPIDSINLNKNKNRLDIAEIVCDLLDVVLTCCWFW